MIFSGNNSNQSSLHLFPGPFLHIDIAMMILCGSLAGGRVGVWGYVRNESRVYEEKSRFSSFSEICLGVATKFPLLSCAKSSERKACLQREIQF